MNPRRRIEEHDIDIAMVDVVENDAVRLRNTAEQAIRTWH